ncbi:MAG: 10 kDa chaperonin [Fimbriimonadales bacterium]|nr:MAG: 10 kDa chaperonin [Fimbriimonadales bacterium]
MKVKEAPSKLKLRPLNDKVVLEVLEEEDKTASGLYLPDTAKKKPQTGKVIAVGDGRLLEDGTRAPMTVKVGDRVLFSKYGGNEVTIDGKEYTILDEDQIYAIIES